MILEVPYFYGGGNTDVFLDWLHSVESFFDFHSIPEVKRLKFVVAKLKGTDRMQWDNYKEDHRSLDTFRYWDDLRAAMRRRFEISGQAKSPSSAYSDSTGFLYCGGI